MESKSSPDRGTYEFDAVAVEALAAGIGLGTPVARKKTPLQVDTKKPAEPVMPVETRSRSGLLRSTVAYLLDLCIIVLSLFVSTGTAYFTTMNEIPLPADLLFTLASKFEPYQIVLGIFSLMLGYFVLFKLLAGMTLGEVLVRVSRN